LTTLFEFRKKGSFSDAKFVDFKKSSQAVNKKVLTFGRAARHAPCPNVKYKILKDKLIIWSVYLCYFNKS